VIASRDSNTCRQSSTVFGPPVSAAVRVVEVDFFVVAVGMMLMTPHRRHRTGRAGPRRIAESLPAGCWLSAGSRAARGGR
jgi:hypothetical protein